MYNIKSKINGEYSLEDKQLRLRAKGTVTI